MSEDGTSDVPGLPALPSDLLDPFLDAVRGALANSGAGASKAFMDAVEDISRRYADRAETYYLLGLAAYELADIGRAIELIGHAHAIDDECSEYADALASLHSMVGQLADGLYYAKLATVLEPHPTLLNLLPFEFSNYFRSLAGTEPSRHYMEAMVRFNQLRFELAAQSCEMELRVNREHAAAYALLGRCQIETGELERAVASFHAAIHFQPDVATHRIHLGEALFRLGRFAEATASQADALRLDTDDSAIAAAALAGQALRGMPMSGGGTAMDDDLARRMALLPEPSAPPKISERRDGRLRIGYISDAAHEGEMGRFLELLVTHHNLDRVEVHLYMQSISGDAVAANLKNAAQSWRAVFDLDDELLSMIIRNDDIDVLVDLTGYGMGARLGLLAEQPAPVRAALMHYPYGHRQPGVNVIFADTGTRDLDEPGAGPGKMVIDLAMGLHAFLPFVAMPDPVAPPVATNGYVTFGGICDLTRLTPDVAATWSALLKSVPESKLLLGGAPTLPGRMKEHVFEYFAHHGCSDRVQFWNAPMEHASIGEFLQYVDVYLDTWPKGGRRDLAEALWMGVPVITLKGDARTARNGASMLYSAGHSDWITLDRSDFVTRAAAVAEDTGALTELRGRLRDDVRRTALFNPLPYVKALEDAYAMAMHVVGGAETAETKPARKRPANKKATKKTAPKKSAKKPVPKRQAAKAAKKAAKKAPKKKAAKKTAPKK